jgi:hypothetical protein
MVETENHAGPRGAPPKMELPDAYHQLLENLYYANEVYKNKGDSGREGIRIACRALAQFIMVRHENPELAAPLMALGSALVDVEKGIKSPILYPEATGGSRSRSSDKKHLIAVASVCLEVLVEKGDKLDEAASIVARRVANWSGLGDQNVNGRTIRNWREQQRALPADERKSFDRMKSDLLSHPDTRRAIEALLQNGPPGIPKS